MCTYEHLLKSRALDHHVVYHVRLGKSGNFVTSPQVLVEHEIVSQALLEQNVQEGVLSLENALLGGLATIPARAQVYFRRIVLLDFLTKLCVSPCINNFPNKLHCLRHLSVFHVGCHFLVVSLLY